MPALSFLSECPVIWCVRRPFSHVRLLVTLRTQSARLLCPFSFKHCASCAKPLIYLIVAYIFPIFFSFSITKEIVVVQLLSHDPFVTSLWPHELQHTRLPCLSPSPGACSNSCPLSWWCHPTISSLVAPFSSCPQSFPASWPFPVSQLFVSGSQIVKFIVRKYIGSCQGSAEEWGGRRGVGV